MAKRFKLKLSLSLFQFCRSDQASSLPKSTLSSSTLFSPINPKSLEISFPTSPEPPPTPNCPSKIMPLISFNIECNQSSAYDTQKMYNSPVSVSYDSDDSIAWPIKPPKGHTKKNRRKKSQRSSISSADSGWFSSDQEDHEIDEESESLTENFDSSFDFGIPISTSSTRKKKNNSSNKVRRLRRYVSNSSWKSGGGGEVPVRKSSVFRRMMMMSCAAEGKVKESFAVVKNSENPCKDFKGSMMEMIVEKQMFEAKDLEQLLQCFLSLNSRHHHEAIVQAFSEIWEALFL